MSEHAHKIQFIQGSITDQEDVKRACHGVDVIVHAASASPAFSEERIFEIIEEGTRNLLQQAKSQNVERFVYVSSTAVYGLPERVPMLESDPIQPYHDPYNRAKAEAEKLCLTFREDGLCLPILRPRTFLGPQRLGTFAMLFEWAKEGRNFPMLGNGQNRYQFLDVYDLCSAVFLACTRPKDRANDTFNIGAKEFGTMKDTYQAVLDAAGFGKKIRCVPAKPALWMLDILSALNLSPLYKRLYQKLNRDYYASIEKAESQLGFKAKYSNNEALVRSFRWYCLHSAQMANATGHGNNVPWNQGILKYGKVFF